MRDATLTRDWKPCGHLPGYEQRLNDDGHLETRPVGKWPEEIGFSMAPFGYSTRAKLIEQTETAVTYKCGQREKNEWCKFSVSIDPRDMTLDAVKILMRQHMDQSH
jgi:hypothetical protein